MTTDPLVTGTARTRPGAGATTSPSGRRQLIGQNVDLRLQRIKPILRDNAGSRQFLGSFEFGGGVLQFSVESLQS
jgi:hypothetical protein